MMMPMMINDADDDKDNDDDDDQGWSSLLSGSRTVAVNSSEGLATMTMTMYWR